MRMRLLNWICAFLFGVGASVSAQVSDIQISEPVRKTVPSFLDFYCIKDVKQQVENGVCTVTGTCLVRPNRTIFKGGEEKIKKGIAIEVPVKLMFQHDRGWYKFKSMDDVFLDYSEQQVEPATLGTTGLSKKENAAPAGNEKADPTKTLDTAKSEVSGEDDHTLEPEEEQPVDVRLLLIKMSQPGKIYHGVCGDYNGSNRVVLWFTKCDNNGLQIEADIHLEDDRAVKRSFSGNVRANSKIKTGYEIILMPNQAPIRTTKDPGFSSVFTGSKCLTITPGETGGFVGCAGGIQMTQQLLDSGPRIMLTPRK